MPTTPSLVPPETLSQEFSPLTVEDKLALRSNLSALTGLRFFAAMLIVFFHMMTPFKLDPKHLSASFGLPQGVTLFFVLSGFILTYNYPKLSGWKESSHFLFLRVARIWPSHLFCVAAAFMLGLGIPDATYRAPETWMNVFLLHSLIPLKKYFFALNFPSWSVSTEFVFYLCFPILIACSRRLRSAPILLSVACVIAGLSLAYNCYTPLEPEGIWFGIVYISPLTRVLEFALGISAAQIFLRYQKMHSLSAKTFASIAFEFCCVAAALFSIFILPTCISKLHLPSRAGALFFYLSESGGAIFFAALIYALAICKGPISKFLSAKVTVWLGEVSFAIYMTHIFVLLIFQKFDLLNRGFPRVGLFCAYLAVLMAVAAAVHHFVETPVRKYAKKFANALWKSA